MPQARTASRFLLLSLAFCLAVSAAHAVTDEEIFRQIRFNFINPGGRALGMGGTFIALADDATAAQANPAGLMQLAAPEFFFEERFIGSDEASESSLVETRAYDVTNERRSITTPTFFSYVVPWERVALGLSRQELLNTRVRVDTIFDFESGGDVITWRGEGQASVRVTNWNAAIAWKPIKWLAVGATVTFSQFDVDSSVLNTVSDPNGAALCASAAGPGGGPIDCDADDNGVLDFDEGGTVAALDVPQHWYSTQTDSDDNDFTFAVGILFTPREDFSAGLVYRADPEFEFDEEIKDGISGLSVFGAGLGNPDARSRQTMHLPAVYGLGLKWHPKPDWTFVADVVRIEYSDLVDGLDEQVGILTNVRRLSVPDVSYDVDDVTEVHVGGEYLFSEARVPWAIRVGAYNDPDNVIAEEGRLPGTSTFGDALEGRDDEFHFTVGAGLVLQQKIQVDGAVSISELGNEGVVSFIYRF